MYFDIFTHGIQPTETEFPTANSIIIQQLELFAEANLLFITLFSDEIQESKMKEKNNKQIWISIHDIDLGLIELNRSNAA